MRMLVMDTEQSASMERDGREVRERRLRLGMPIEDLANEAGVSPDTLSDFEAGKRRPRDTTVQKVVSALDRIEHEVGLDAPPAQTPSADIIEFDVAGDFGVHVVVKGPVKDAELLQRQVIGIIREIRKVEKEGDPPAG